MRLIAPCYNDARNKPLSTEAVRQHHSPFHWHVISVDDGSTDATWNTIQTEARLDPRILGFSRNVGHQNALKAGMEFSLKHLQTDICITPDADLRTPLNSSQTW